MNITSASSLTTSAGGRPKGNTNLLKQLRKEAIIAARNEVTELYKNEKVKKKRIGQILSRGWLKQIIQNVCVNRGITENISHINIHTIRRQKIL